MNIFEKYEYATNDKLNNFEKYVSKEFLARFLVRYELFKLIKNVKGSIIECGVHYGGGIMAWSKLSAIIEPYSLRRKIIGFDTFDGFPSINKIDLENNSNDDLKVGRFQSHNSIFDELKEIIELYENDSIKTIYLNNSMKVQLVKGDATVEIPKYIDQNKHLIVSLLFLDFDLYEPTKIALEYFIDRMPKGGVIAFDEINNELWRGETMAVLEHFGSLNKLEIKKFSFDPNIAYAVIQ